MAYKLARIFSVIGLIALPLLLVALLTPRLYVDYPNDGPQYVSATENIAILTITISSLSMLVALIGTSSTIMLGWRAERRQSAEFKLKIEQLELELAQARKNAAQPAQISN
jgi:hypothetical protein